MYNCSFLSCVQIASVFEALSQTRLFLYGRKSELDVQPGCSHFFTPFRAIGALGG